MCGCGGEQRSARRRTISSTGRTTVRAQTPEQARVLNAQGGATLRDTKRLDAQRRRIELN